MNRRPNQFAAHRMFLGGLALVVMVIAVFVAFRSTRGIPLVPRYNLTVRVANAAQLTGGADVTIAGVRVGLVTDVKPVAVPGKQPEAQIDLALDPKYEPLSADSVFSIEQSGSLGRKEVAIQPGVSNQTLSDGAAVPISTESKPTVDIDQVLDAFDQGARNGTRESFEALGLGSAGRGADLNAALQHLPRTLSTVAPAMHVFAAPSTELGNFTSALHGWAAELAPASRSIPGLTTDLNSTFQAFDSTSRPYLQDFIAKSPDFLSTVTRTARRTRPLLKASTKLFSTLEPGTATLPETAGPLADAVTAGARNFKLVPRLSSRAATAIQNVADFGQSTPVEPGLSRLTEFVGALQPLVGFLAPAENTCQYVSLLARNLSSLVSEPIATGTSVRAGGVVTGVARNSERGPSSAISEVKAAKALGPVHSNPYPNTAAPNQDPECEAGHEPYITTHPEIGNAPGLQPAKTEDVKLP
jgi:virulence factor Mce-like protein